ncbi:RNA 2'-phosphotransferase [Metasolibacillus meyeri]|uniref:Probable RNA 2'-phosphotransferase n=1 Tax=Metasolibacillus meyeri TaxID=1071052 RepID=A0AAW9NUH8_9BACL|nr:RNA 2'-phosphotransferase [Metasolibacillus meyeri]MEC1179504.1 RNA 2'-phosphotransferase [Metasolibacillus meyeri]
MNYQELSKEVSYALRHAPSEYGLSLDENGWVDVQELLKALKENNKGASIELNDLISMIEASDKKRHEIVGDKIRALYGHTIPSPIKKEIGEPPEYLYHGTARRFVESIKEKGLLSQERQHVHLSVDEDTAYEVGKRRDEKPVILKIKAKLAFMNGVSFFKGNDKVWLSNSINSEYIEFH